MELSPNNALTSACYNGFVHARARVDTRRRWRVLLASLENGTLSSRQRTACVVRGRFVRIIAGAGTGKTTTLRAKATFLIASGQASPGDIVALTYSKKAQQDLLSRFTADPRTSGITVSTLHSLGLKILSHAHQEKPLVARHADDEKAMFVRVQRYLESSVRHGNLRAELLTFLTEERYAQRLEDDFTSLEEYDSYCAHVELRTLKGELVKSYAELTIANFLCVNSVEYRYEAPYQFRTSTETHLQYRPDFYLTRECVYIEHFGVDRNGNTARNIDAAHYSAGMKWKIEQHALHKTPLIQTFSYELFEGNLVDSLRRQLQQYNVELTRLPDNQILDLLNSSSYFSEFSKLLATFIIRYREHKKEQHQFLKHVPASQRRRAELFWSIFQRTHDAYLASLRANKEIDFSDMLSQATEEIVAGKTSLPYKFILVDEFQDISLTKVSFLFAMASSVRGQLVVVSDDWQSIYRFAGCDPKIMRNFPGSEGSAGTVKLDHTFRFDGDLEEVTSAFIMRNPWQLRKRLSSRPTTASPSINVVERSTQSEGLHCALETLNGESKDSESVLIIARTSHQEPVMRELRRRFANLTLSFSTAHSAKGLEAEHVVILNVQNHKSGFPCQKPEDPLLDALLPQLERFPWAEERRLFYVAMTRAKRSLWLISQQNRRSVFLAEIIDAHRERIAFDPPAAEFWLDLGTTSGKAPPYKVYIASASGMCVELASAPSEYSVAFEPRGRVVAHDMPQQPVDGFRTKNEAWAFVAELRKSHHAIFRQPLKSHALKSRPQTLTLLGNKQRLVMPFTPNRGGR